MVFLLKSKQNLFLIKKSHATQKNTENHKTYNCTLDNF